VLAASYFQLLLLAVVALVGLYIIVENVRELLT